MSNFDCDDMYSKANRIEVPYAHPMANMMAADSVLDEIQAKRDAGERLTDADWERDSAAWHKRSAAERVLSGGPGSSTKRAGDLLQKK